MTFKEMKTVIDKIEELKKQQHELEMMLEIQEEIKVPLVISNQGYDYHHIPVSNIIEARLTDAIKEEIQNIISIIHELSRSAELDY